MNKLFRKLLVLVLSLTVAISLVGCNKGGDNSGSNDNGGNQTPPVVDDGSPNTSTVQPEAPSISMSNAINFIVGEVKSANVSTKNIDGEVVYTSSDPSVATASNGFITAVGAGTAIITASYGEATPVSCNVTVSYGDYLPSLGLQSNLTGSQTFAVNRTYDVLPYVSFNKIAYYDDATFEYEVSDPTVLSVENGVITTLKTGTATLTINASWRDFTAKENVAGKTQTNTLSQTFDVVVRDNVAFYDNGTLLKAKTLMTPASFQDAADYGNVHKVVPTVIVNGETKSVSAEDITVKPVGASIDGVDYVWDPANQTITVNSMRTAGSGAVVEFKYVGADNTEYLDNFVIYFERPVEVLTSGVELFSAKLGTYKVKSGDGYVEKTLESYAWGKDVELLDAFQDGNALTINNTTGAVTGLAVNQDTYIDTTVVLGTMTEIYEIPVRAAQVYMATAQDIKVALERINDPIVASGYHLLLNDVDMDGVLVDNRIKGTEAETFTLYDGNGNLVVSYPRNISFGGVFDGAGHVIYNATTVLPNRNFVYYKEYDFVNNQPVGTVYKNDPSFGFFHKIDQNAIIKDVAFVNAKGTGNTSNAYGLSAPLSFGLYGTVENCYIHIAPDSPTVRGPFANIHGSSDIRNTVIYYEMPEDYNFTLEAGKIASKDLYAWGYGSLGQNVDGVIKTPTGFSNNYVISKAPLSFNTADAKALNDDDSANDSIVYGENETKLHYNFSIFDTVHGKVEHTVQSTAGERLVEYEKTKITGKTRVISNFQRYDSYEDFAASDYAGIATYNKAYTVNNPYWVLAGNVPIWHSLIDQHADKFYATINDNATLEVDCYDTAEFDVKLYGGSVQDLVLTSSSDLIQIEGTLIKGLKVGTGATVTANFTFGGKAYTRVFDVDVANPFYYNDGSVDFDTKTSLREGTSIDLTVLIKGEVVENVTYTTTATEFLSISGNTINGIKLGRNNVVKASFTYQGTQYELEFLVTVLDPIAEDAVVTIDGVDLTEESFNVVIGESATIGIISDAGAVQSVTVADPNGLFSVNNNVITGELYGETILNVTFVIDGVSHVKEVKATTTRTTVTIDDLVVFDAYVGAILSSSIDNTGVVNAVVSYPGAEDDFILNKENGGIDANGKIRVKTAKLDPEAGFPYINKFDFAASPVIKVVLGTNKKIYEFTNVEFWSSIINDASELKAALDIDYTKTTHNYGFYKLANNINVATMETFVYNGINNSGVANNVNGNSGFLGLFDGCGYTIDNYNVGKYGLFGNFLYNGGTLSKGGPIIKDIAFTNVKSLANDTNTSGTYSLLGKYTADHNYWPDSHLKVNNLYVSFKDDTNVNGILAYCGFAHLTNIVIDTVGNTVAPGSVLAGKEYGAEVAGKAIPFSHNQYNDGSAFLQNTRFMQPARATTDYINNVITLGATPVVYAWGYGSGYGSNWVYQGGQWKMRNTGTLDPYCTIETYMAFAANQVKGDVPLMTGMKDGFKAICGTNTNALVGYVCETCGEEFSKTAGDCSKCGVAMTRFANLWNTPWSFTWTLVDVASWENKAENSVYKTGIYVFDGVSKYNTEADMKSAYTANNNLFAAFTGETGNNMWAVSADGVLSWKGANA